MKQKDIALIILIAGISGIVSLIVSNILFATPQNRQQKVAVIPIISSQFTLPSQQFFNSQSIDPTQIIQIQNNNTANPFSGSGQ